MLPQPNMNGKSTLLQAFHILLLPPSMERTHLPHREKASDGVNLNGRMDCGAFIVLNELCVSFPHMEMTIMSSACSSCVGRCKA